MKQNPFATLFDELREELLEAAEEKAAEVVEECAREALREVIKAGDKFAGRASRATPAQPQERGGRGLPKRRR